ncbi:hypothetical protein NHX12_028287, partial [Muraenolepis orangiensis]
MESVVRITNKLCLWGLLLLWWWSLNSGLALGGYNLLKASTESSDRNALRARFRTSSTDGLLFLAAGRSDHILVVKLDFGSGERWLDSERGTQLNDLAWHSVEVYHEQTNVTLTVDKNSHTFLKMPGPHHDLDTDVGLFVGGSGGLDRHYLPGDLSGFRGCVDEVVFNEHDMLSSLRPYTGFKSVHEVSLGCSPQFFATEEDPVSFFSSKAYISLLPWSAQQEGLFECVVHTSATEGIVLYSSARGGDFVAVEIQEGLLVAMVGKDAGYLEIETNPGSAVTTFSYTDLAELKVYYVHTGVRNSRMVFRVGDGERVSNTVVLRVMAVVLEFTIANNTGLEITQGEHAVIGSKQLAVQTNAARQAVEIRYDTVEPPQYGELQRLHSSGEWRSTDSFSQRLLEKERLRYSNTFRDIQTTAATDFFKCKVTIAGRATTELLFPITVKWVRFNLERIMYIQDDSEATQDQFTFIASTGSGFKYSIAEDEIGSKEGMFNISIRLVNDQKPVRVVDKVFNVVREGQRLLTVEDLCYHDADSDFDDGQLLYTRRGIPVGDLVLANDTSHRLFSFHQQDLVQKRVLFVHKGVSSGRFVLFVSDGKHFVSSLLDISAHDPFLRVTNNSGLLVQKGHRVTFSTSNFSVASNLDIRDDSEVVFGLQQAPKYGSLFQKETKVVSFTLYDLKKGFVSYRHNDRKHLADSFNLTVQSKGLTIVARVHVKVYLESHQRPPILQNCHKLLVEEGQPVKIDETKLEVTHEDNLPAEIVFTVRETPSHGFLRRFEESQERYVGTGEFPVATFSQEDVNAGNVQYVQVEPDQAVDTFVLDATNGVTEVTGIAVSVDVIPRLIPLLVSNFTLNEGGSKALTQEVLRVTNRHFSGINFLYSVTAPPLHGHIEHSRSPGVRITSFTRRQVEHDFIYYVHDSSESLDDSFTVTANDTGLRKQSLPRTLHIQLSAVNDEPPIITANRVLRVWAASVTEIRPEDLRAEDSDSPPEELAFMVTPPSNGHLALKSAPARPVLNFTQALLDRGQLLFVHK